MFKCNNLRHASVVMLLAVIVFLSGCAYPLKYGLNQRDIIVSKAILPLKVQVAEFTDTRDPEERDKSARMQKEYTDLGDYTYDRDFRGEIAKEISRMLVKHLNYSEIFKSVALGDYTSDEVSESKLDSLNLMGVDAVLLGGIKHFYGYYDRNIGREILYGLPFGIFTAYCNLMIAEMVDSWTDIAVGLIAYVSVVTGGVFLVEYLESLHKRDIEYRAELRAKLIDTSTHNILWEDKCKVFMKEHKSMPSYKGKDKKTMAIVSLREAVNKMVESISNVALPTKD